MQVHGACGNFGYVELTKCEIRLLESQQEV
ncbi:MAG: hypothetical protein OJF60_002853 [Burkholderiaceae bacterium]|jgi:hypothetical protein|nr:MAG: hypothetical protein OJF60_002853 [Burkholderiaceae bacterium]